MATLFDNIEVAQEDVGSVIKDLFIRCHSCRLSLIHPFNRGFIYRGNPDAEIAVVYEAPRDAETERGVSMVGTHGRFFERWMRLLKLDTGNNGDVFITSVIQCQPPQEEQSGMMVQREPEKAEISACFGPKCLRVLRAMPNLKVVMTLGWVAAGALLGLGETSQDKPKAKSHDTMWFETSLLPGIPIFCMVDPTWVIKNPTPDRKAVVERALECFQREYLEQHKIVQLAKDAQARREELGLGML
jgi:uracil-DNA glycosylase family 4